MKRIGFSLLLCTFIFTACSKDDEAVSPSSSQNAALIYLTSALDIMQKNSINRYKIDWITFRQNTLNYSPNAKTEKDTYDAIRYAIKNLGDNHSTFIPPTGGTNKIIAAMEYKETLVKITEAAATTLIGKRLSDKVGFIRIPPFSGTGTAINNFATSIQTLIQKIDTSTIKGWIVDLRQNTGGNMWPMLAGIGPILGEGLVGKFIDPDNNVVNWYYEKGTSKSATYVIANVTNYYTLINPSPYVAVLTDNYTASSGEATTIAFRGREKTKSFGNYTYGVSTANMGFSLSDGAVLNLTISTMADRNGILYGGKIQPDQILISPFIDDPSNSDLVVIEALKWLESNI